MPGVRNIKQKFSKSSESPFCFTEFTDALTESWSKSLMTTIAPSLAKKVAKEYPNPLADPVN